MHQKVKPNAQVHKQLPQNRKHDSLQSIRNDPRHKAPPKQPNPPIRSHHRLCSIGVPNTSLIDLAIGFDNAEGVGYRVGHNGCTKTYERLPN